MGIGIVLIFWAIAGTIIAAIGACVFGGVTAFLTKRVLQQRKRVIVLAATFPFVCLGWAGVLFVFQAVVNDVVLHRDPGLGDTWYCPLPNGYAITMIDVTDQGWIYNPKTQSGGGIGEQEDAIAGVRTVQVAGRYILGAADSHFSDSGKPTDVNSWFVLDTNTDKRSEFKNLEEELTRAASQLGVQLKLEDIETVYSRYRFTWFEVFAGLLLVIPLAAYLVMLAGWIMRLRRTRGLTPSLE